MRRSWWLPLTLLASSACVSAQQDTAAARVWPISQQCVIEFQPNIKSGGDTAAMSDTKRGLRVMVRPAVPRDSLGLVDTQWYSSEHVESLSVGDVQVERYLTIQKSDGSKAYRTIVYGSTGAAIIQGRTEDVAKSAMDEMLRCNPPEQGAR